MLIDILTLFPPKYFQGPLEESILKKAQLKGLIEIRIINIRDFAENKHHRVDDRPYGGGPGMVLMPGPVVRAIRSVKDEGARVIHLSPQGKLLNAKVARDLAQETHLIFLSGHYEGIDERALNLEVDEEISIGDYVLTNGSLAAIVLLDSVARFVPGVLGHEDAANEDSFEKGLLDCPHYTRPEVFEQLKVPEILLSGDHEKIARWRHEKAIEKTKSSRPDLYRKYLEP
jgi:tRNA (guanine37-N1)-methyltransferase